jgi:predicted nuclease with TOPRIM domain
MNEKHRHFIDALRSIVEMIAAEFKARDAQIIELKQENSGLREENSGLYDSIQRLETERSSLERQLLRTGSSD